LTSSSNDSLRRSWRLVPVALLATTVTLFLATGMLYMQQSEQRELLAVTVRTSGWVAYQAQLEYVKADAALDIAVKRPTADALSEAELRLEVLLSRLSILYESEEGRMLQDVEAFEPSIRAYELRIAGYLEQLPSLPPNSGETSATLQRWRGELDPLGKELQEILESSVVYNDEIYARERELAQNPAAVPLGLMFVSGTALVALLFLQATRDRQRLAAMLAARAEAAAMESNLRAAIEAMPASIVIMDPKDDSISFLNSTAAKLVDPSPDHPEWQRLIRAVREAQSAPDARDKEVMNIAFPGPYGEITSLRGAQREIAWEGRSQVLLALTDVTQIRDAELQVMQAAKLANLGEMATAIAHEANQPLAVIRMAAANALRLLQSGADPEAIAAKLNRIGDQVERVKRITNQVRRYGRMPSRQLAPFSLRNAMELAIGFVAEQYRAAGIRLDIALDLAPELMVAGEQTMFEQVIVNLLVNSRDAFESERPDLAEPAVAVRASTDGAQVVIAVEDNAGGIRPDMLERLFEPFATTKPADKGTGLGLSMCRHVVRDMNGSISAANVDRGARFTVILPVASAEPKALQAA
jgi:signal transduction histidine kinase